MDEIMACIDGSTHKDVTTDANKLKLNKYLLFESHVLIKEPTDVVSNLDECQGLDYRK